MADLTQLIGFAADIAMFTLIWLVQLVIYPAFHRIERDTFIEWHQRYTRNISFVVVPLMLAQAGTAALRMRSDTALTDQLRLACLIAAWAVTFALSVPCHKKLHERGRDETVINRLVETNWLRTAAWTAVMLLGWMPD